jgi:hypothetical protein
MTAGLAAVPALLAAAVAARAAEGNEDITAVSARASKDYVRVKLANGSFQPEAYAFGEGGCYGGPTSGDSIDRLKFVDIAHIIAGPLAAQSYLPAKDPKKARLVIMLYWGTTDVAGPVSTSDGYQVYQKAIQDYNALLKDDPNMARAVLNSGLMQAAMENKLRDHQDFTNSQLLGYDSEALIGTEYGEGMRHTALHGHRDELVEEIEDNRYFVVLMAYDFQLLWKEKKHKLLWETRFSINQRRNDFAKALPAMSRYASRYFGQDSHGLVRKPIPRGDVEVGDLKSLGAVPEK